jgi:hypothetical protein
LKITREPVNFQSLRVPVGWRKTLLLRNKVSGFQCFKVLRDHIFEGVLRVLRFPRCLGFEVSGFRSRFQDFGDSRNKVLRTRVSRLLGLKVS